MNEFQDSRKTILLVDDEPANLQVLRHTLNDDYRLLFAKNGAIALELVQTEQPDLVLLDIMMPDITGYQVCETIKADPASQHIAVIFITALSDVADEERGLDLGAVDYITKPFSPPIVRARVRTHLSLVQAQELKDTRLHIIRSLGKAAEYRDNETGMHIIRMSHYAYCLAKKVGYGEAAAEELLSAAPMHDVGKIGIPDKILLKPGKLDADEWRVMRQHTTIGAAIIGEHQSSLLRLAAEIARHHHEKWDGSGYPDGLSGTDIPHQARIIALVDVFDALTSKRPYKEAWPVANAIDYIKEQSGKHFDPDLVAAFIECLPEILALKERWADN